MRLPDEIATLTPRDAARALEILAAQTRWRDVPAGAPVERARAAVDAVVPLGVGPQALLALAREVAARHGSGEDFAREAAERAVAARDLLLASDQDLVTAVAHDTGSAAALLESLRDEGALAARARALFPELAALADSQRAPVSPDYEMRSARTALLDHLTLRTLGRKLAGLERGERRRFQPAAESENATVRGLSPAAFDALAARARRVSAAGLLPLVRSALLFRDVAKAPRGNEGTAGAGQRLAHNESAAALLLSRAREPGSGIALLSRALSRSPFGLAEVALMVAAHGLVGQHLRGECPLAALAYFAVGARRLSRLMEMGHQDGAALVLDAFGVLNACDVASVREGLFDDALSARFFALETRLLELVADRAPDLDNVAAMAEALTRAEAPRADTTPTPRGSVARAALAERFARLRTERVAKNPAARDELDRALAALDEREADALHRELSNCQLWYAESATGDLAPDATIKLLALCVSAATRAGLRPANPTPGAHRRMFHVDLLPLAQYLSGLGEARTYALRLIETMLAPVSVAGVLGLDGDLAVPARLLLGEEVEGERAGLGTLSLAARGERAIALEWRASREADALLTLLGVYERKNSAAFHATLKSLCDLYGLRKDDFDRIHAEASYLDAMNSARSDKARLCDFVVPGAIFEIGPGGGVVLDLLQDRYPTSRVVGLDVSRAVVEALTARKAREEKRWEIVEGDAFELEKLTGGRTLSSVVFCSILHEIYSYVPWDDRDGRGRGKFRLGSVRAIVGAAFRALAPRGRIVIRDGVMPPPGTRVVEFLTPEGMTTFELYAREFQGRKITFERVDERRVRLPSNDAHAFLFTYVWGPASFPYEIREQYGVETYERYGEILLSACGEADPPFTATMVPLPPDARSYLQPGYVQNLAPLVRLFDADGRTPARLPDSNALWVIQKD